MLVRSQGSGKPNLSYPTYSLTGVCPCWVNPRVPFLSSMDRGFRQEFSPMLVRESTLTWRCQPCPSQGLTEPPCLSSSWNPAGPWLKPSHFRACNHDLTEEKRSLNIASSISLLVMECGIHPSDSGSCSLYRLVTSTETFSPQ